MLRDTVAEAVWKQRKYCGGNLLMSIIYVVLTDDTENNAFKATKYEIHPLLRIRKCRKAKDSYGCCMVFVDEIGRVYPNWEDYIEENTLAKGIMVAPSKGYYCFNSEGEVQLQLFYTPASSAAATVKTVFDVASNLDTVGTIAIPALITGPIGIIGGAVFGVASGVYSIISSTIRLRDRKAHGQSTEFRDTQARAEWMGIVSGFASVATLGVSTAVKAVATTGRNVPRIARGAVNVVNATGLLIQGAGFISLEYGEFDIVDWATFGTSLFLFSHSVNNFETASKMAKASRDGTISKVRGELKNSQRVFFDRALEETIKLRGEDKGKMDVIRSLRRIPDRKQALTNSQLVSFKKMWNSISSLEKAQIGLSSILTTKNAIEAYDYVLEYVSEKELEKLSDIAVEFKKYEAERIAKDLERDIPFEEILLKAYEITNELCHGKDIDKFIDRVEPALLQKKLKEYFKEMVPKPGIEYICRKCRGEYSITDY